MRKFIRFGVVTLVGLIACALLAYVYFGYAPTPAEPPLSAHVTRTELQVGGLTRGYLAYVPQGLPPQSPLLIVLHGTGLDGARMRAWTGYEFDSLADTRHFAVVYPDGIGQSWNDCRRAGQSQAKLLHADDLGFIRAVITRLQAEQGIDPARVYVMGYSNGGQMAFRLVEDAPGLVAGLAVAGASLPTPDNSLCARATSPLPTLIVAGTDDPVTPYGGGEVNLFGLRSYGTVLSAEATATVFARRNGLESVPERLVLLSRSANDDTRVVEQAWRERGKSPVLFYTVEGGGHAVPQPVFRYPRVMGRTSRALDMPARTVAFFGL
jgi:polyhydroxybutyrate depolymerase